MIEFVAFAILTLLWPLILLAALLLTILQYAFVYVALPALGLIAIAALLAGAVWTVRELIFAPILQKLKIIAWIAAFAAMVAAPYFITPKSWEAVAYLAALIAFFAYFQCVVRDR